MIYFDKRLQDNETYPECCDIMFVMFDNYVYIYFYLKL